MKLINLNLVFLFVLSFQLNAQTNLVPNYSFEDYSHCPNDISNIDPFCDDWFTPMANMDTLPLPPFSYPLSPWGSSDYFHICSIYPPVGVPGNSVGYQVPKNGNAYVGIGYVNQGVVFINYKEYIEVKLDSILILNKKYCIEYYYSIAEFGQSQQYYPIEIGVLLTDTLVYRLSGIGTDQPQNIIAKPQIKQQLPLVKDTFNWIKVSGSFIAQGGEQYLTIGNFQKTDTLIDKNLYVYIEDVKLWLCDSGDTINPVLPKELKVYPIPTNDKNITFEYVNGDLNGYHLLIYNSIGQKVYSYIFNESISLKQFQFIRFSSGMYHFTLRSEEKINYDGKIIILE